MPRQFKCCPIPLKVISGQKPARSSCAWWHIFHANTRLPRRWRRRHFVHRDSLSSDDPNTITFFTVAIEVRDASIDYVEDHLDEACSAFLPGWSSRFTREVT
jgi:hypothetical protein